MRIKILLRYERFRNFTEKCGSRKYALHEKQMIRIEVNFSTKKYSSVQSMANRCSKNLWKYF